MAAIKAGSDDGEREAVDLNAMVIAGSLEIWEPIDAEVADMLRHTCDSEPVKRRHSRSRGAGRCRSPLTIA
jgi:hypothetical protein